ncbi:MAG: VWA domain-containing protein [Pseudolysinimonas sp.]
MALETPWLGIVVAALGGAGLVIGLLYALRGRRRTSGSMVVGAERVRALPSVARAARTRVVALTGVFVLATVAITAAAVVAARPMAEHVIQPETLSRDIMLCLDVSGSMTDVDGEVVDVFSRLAKDFKGERVGLVIFNSSPVQIFPLTDDYNFILDQLDRMRASLNYEYDVTPEHWVGTLNGAGASLVGDGLAACALGFDHPDAQRARSIIFATDNEVNGAQTVTLSEAAAYADSLGVRVFAIDPVTPGSATSLGLQQASIQTGGRYFSLHDATTVESVVAEVQAEDATMLDGAPRIVRVDAPGPWLAVLAVAALALVLVGWRART